jgi:hypothetical protein
MRTTELDRGNMANAITDNFREDIGIDQNQFNVGQQMLSLGIVLFEIPSNMVLYRVGPGKWLTLQLFLFGTVSTFQAWQTNYASFIVTRFLLGITESGFIPGGLWTLSTWYTRKETAKRVMVFYLRADGRLHLRKWYRTRLVPPGLVQEAAEYIFTECQDLYRERAAYPQHPCFDGRSDEGAEEEAHRSCCVHQARKSAVPTCN